MNTLSNSTTPAFGEMRTTSGGCEVWDGTQWVPYPSWYSGGAGGVIYSGNTNYTLTNAINNTTTYESITANYITVDGQPLSDILSNINNRLNILVPDLKKLEKYAALKEAYDNYKLLEAMLSD